MLDIFDLVYRASLIMALFYLIDIELTGKIHLPHIMMKLHWIRLKKFFKRHQTLQKILWHD